MYIYRGAHKSCSPRYILHGIYWKCPTVYSMFPTAYTKKAAIYCGDKVHIYCGCIYILWECRLGNMTYILWGYILWGIYCGEQIIHRVCILCGTPLRNYIPWGTYTVGNSSLQYISMFPTVYIYCGGYTVGNMWV